MPTINGWEEDFDPLAAELRRLLQILGLDHDDLGEIAAHIIDQTQHTITIEFVIGGTTYTFQIERSARKGTNGYRLSPRELQIAQLITEGMPNKAIAAALKIRPDTVGTYMKRMYLKLNVNTRAEMVAKVIRDRMM